jgi:hypothetical protein
MTSSRKLPHTLLRSHESKLLDGKLAVEDLTEEAALFLENPDFEIGAALGGQSKLYLPAFDGGSDTPDVSLRPQAYSLGKAQLGDGFGNVFLIPSP